MVQAVLPNDANPLGYILAGTVMHLIDMAGAIAAIRHTRSLLVTAAVDGLQFLHPIKVGDLIILEACVTAVWSTSLEVEVEVFSEETLTGKRRLTSRAYLTFVTTDRDGRRSRIPGLILETEEERQRAAEAELRRAQRLEAHVARWSFVSGSFYSSGKALQEERRTGGTSVCSSICVRCSRRAVAAAEVSDGERETSTPWSHACSSPCPSRSF